jgi:hypothetical protein
MVGLPLLLAGLVCAWDLPRGHQGGPPLHPGLQDWDIEDIAEHLHGAGLSFRVVAVAERGDPGDSAYLTTTALTWRDLNQLRKVPERLADWEGTVYCERALWEDDRSVRRAVWHGCCLCAGPFIFFGDPDLLERIRAALGGTPG